MCLSVSQSVCLSVTRLRSEKNNWTDLGPVWSEDSWGLRNTVRVWYGSPDPPRRGEGDSMRPLSSYCGHLLTSLILGYVFMVLSLWHCDCESSALICVVAANSNSHYRSSRKDIKASVKLGGVNRVLESNSWPRPWVWVWCCFVYIRHRHSVSLGPEPLKCNLVLFPNQLRN